MTMKGVFTFWLFISALSGYVMKSWIPLVAYGVVLIVVVLALIGNLLYLSFKKQN